MKTKKKLTDEMMAVALGWVKVGHGPAPRFTTSADVIMAEMDCLNIFYDLCKRDDKSFYVEIVDHDITTNCYPTQALALCHATMEYFKKTKKGK